MNVNIWVEIINFNVFIFKIRPLNKMMFDVYDAGENKLRHVKHT